MTLQVKIGGSYSDVAEVHVKRSGAYQAVADMLAKIDGEYVSILEEGAETIGGVPIGSAGSAGTIYSGYKLAGGEEFETLDLLTINNPGGKYIPSHRRRGRRAINSGANDYYWTPEHTGYKDANRGVAIGSSVSDLLSVSDSKLTLATRLSTTLEKSLAWTTTASWGPQRPQSSSAIHSAGYQAVKWPCVIEARVKIAQDAAMPAGCWPAFWTENVLPTWANTGEFDFEWNDVGALHVNFITGDSVGDSVTNSVVDTSDGLYHTFSMVVTAATIKFYRDGTLLGTATKRPDASVIGPMFWWFRMGVDLTPSIYGMSYSPSAWTGVTAAMEVDYVRIWTLPTATDLGYKGIVGTANIASGGTVSLTLPGKTDLWGTASVTEYCIFQPIEGAEPGIDELALTGAPNTWYAKTAISNGVWGPAALAWNASTRALTSSAISASGRLIGHLVAWDDTNGGLAGFARIVINVGPASLSLSQTVEANTAFSLDLYAAIDCGMLTTNPDGTRGKIITLTSAGGSGLTYNASTGLLTGTPAAGTYTITFTCTNSIGQSSSGSLALTAETGVAFSPSTLSGLTYWYDNSDTSTITASSGSVTSQVDKKTGVTVRTATGTARPTTGTRALNGKNGLDYNGSSNYLGTPKIWTTSSARTYAIVLVKDADPTSGVTARLVSDRASNGAFVGLLTTGRLRAFADTASGNTSVQTADGAIPNATPSIILVTWAATLPSSGWKMYVNGGAARSPAVSSEGSGGTLNPNGNLLTFGADSPAGTPANFFDGAEFEQIAYSRVLTTSELNQLGSYLATKYGLTWTAIP